MGELQLLPLCPEEGFVLSRLDVPLTTPEVAALTGLELGRVESILARLAQLGAVKSPSGGPSSPSVNPQTGTADPGADADSAPSADDSPPAEEPPDEDAEGTSASNEATAAADEVSFRKLYETTFRGATLEARVAAAQRADPRELMALCLDAEPPVLFAVLASPACSLSHARFAARWHPTAAGLEAIGQRGTFISDPQVQRLLLRNSHLSELMTRRILGGKRMLDAYKVSMDTDVPERTRQFARAVLRSKFGTSQGEERAGVISATDGRVLAALAGLSLDGRATSILCARSYTSALFVQNLARFGSCPPQLLAHLLRQPLVRRQNHLKTMLLQHPNMPAEAKRKL
jgi:hypothetical protein